MISQKKQIFNDLFLLAPLALFFILFDLGNGSLASWDEAIYASVARDIVRSGDWFRLTFGGVLWFDKPPLAIWATAFFFKIAGVHEASARLFSALCGAGIVILTYFLGRKLFDRWTAFCGALVLLSTSHYLRLVRFGMTDAPFLFFMTLAFYLFWVGRSKSRYLIYSGVAIGLAVMTKGFAALLIFPVIWAYLLWSGRVEILNRGSYWIGIVAAVLIALPWNLYQLLAYHEQFVRDVVTKHLVDRTTSAIEGHAGNFYYYVRVLVNKFHPWIPIGLFSAPYFLWRAFRKKEDGVIFISCWMFIIFAIITGIQTKLPWYVLPVYPALSLCTAYFFVKIFNSSRAFYAKIIFFAVLIVQAGYSHIWRMDYAEPLKYLAPLVSRIVPKNEVVYFYRYHDQPAGIFYLERDIRYLDTSAEFASEAGKKNFYCLVKSQDMEELEGVCSQLKISSVGLLKGIFFLFNN